MPISVYHFHSDVGRKLTSDRRAKRMYMIQTTVIASCSSSTSLPLLSWTILPRDSRSSTILATSAETSISSSSDFRALEISGPLANSTSTSTVFIRSSISAERLLSSASKASWHCLRFLRCSSASVYAKVSSTLPVSHVYGNLTHLLGQASIPAFSTALASSLSPAF